MVAPLSHPFTVIGTNGRSRITATHPIRDFTTCLEARRRISRGAYRQAEFPCDTRDCGLALRVGRMSA